MNDDVKRRLAEVKAQASTPVEVPDAITDPIDREMVRRGRARVVWSAWGNGPVSATVVDNPDLHGSTATAMLMRREIADDLTRTAKGKRGASRRADIAAARAWQIFDAGGVTKRQAATEAHADFPDVALQTIRNRLKRR